jgi:hypothetical protein
VEAMVGVRSSSSKSCSSYPPNDPPLDTELARFLFALKLATLPMLTLGTVLDFRRRKRAREGLQLRGGEMLTVDEFNRVTKGDGFGLYVKD